MAEVTVPQVRTEQVSTCQQLSPVGAHRCTDLAQQVTNRGAQSIDVEIEQFNGLQGGQRLHPGGQVVDCLRRGQFPCLTQQHHHFVESPHHAEHGVHLSRSSGIRPPAGSAVRHLRNLLPGSEAVEDRAAGEAARAQAFVDAARRVHQQVATGLASVLVDGKGLRSTEGKRDTTQPETVGTIGPQVALLDVHSPMMTTPRDGPRNDPVGYVGRMVTPATPYLQVDLIRLRRNIRRTAELAATAGVALRPHVKTHKSIDIARLQLSAGAIGITVATIGEAEVFASHRCTDIFIAYPLWLEARSAARLRDLANRASVAIGVDSVEGAANAGRLLGGSGVEVLVEVDSGHHRSGTTPLDAGGVALAAHRSGLKVRGVFTFPGHSYSPGALESSAHDEAAALASARDSLESLDIEVSVVSGGSTPSLSHSDIGVLNELRPGVYVFGDAQQWELGATSPEDIALTCRATVVSHTGARMVLDSGSKVLGADRAAYASGFGRVLQHPDARIILLSEHHAVVDLGSEQLPALGSQVDVVPNHVCTAVNLVNELWVEEAGALRAWPVTARGLNS